MREPIFNFTNIRGTEILSINHFSKIVPRIGESIVNDQGKVYQVIDVIHSSWFTNASNMASQIDVVVKLRVKNK